MTTNQPPKTPEEWWSTSIIDMKPGSIRIRGYAIEELIGRIGFAEMVYLMTRGELPQPGAARLLEAALVAAVDHGPQAPSIAAARMAMTCGVGINNAMACAINMLGDVHGGAGEQCVALLNAIAARLQNDATEQRVADAVDAELRALAEQSISHVPGFGHRFHPLDPRANIDGATAVVYAELGFAPALCRGLFVLSRSVGALAHAWEEMQAGQRNKGPIPRHLLWNYTGPPQRSLPEERR
jgi:citrate synthase